jgi:amino acid adenylation domain-containing protein
MFGLLNTPVENLEVSGLHFSPVKLKNETARFDLEFLLKETEGGVTGQVKYATDLFRVSTVQRLLKHLELVLEKAVADPGQRFSEWDILTGEERRQLLGRWNDTETEYPRDKCVHEMFEERAERTPENLAVAFEEQEISYGELNRRANQLAHYLRGLGVNLEVRVGICVERSVDMVVGLMGILKSGGAYVPLDPSYPAERLRFMMEDAQVPVLLTHESWVDRLPAHKARVVCLDRDWPEISGQSSENPVSRIRPLNLAYVIYTSGSTGQPKGAMNTHDGLCNRLLWMQQAYQLTPADRILQKTPFGFDVSVWEFFWPLMTGAALVVARPGGHTEPEYLVKLIGQKQITTLHFVPSMLQVFLEEPGLEQCSCVKRVICSGEALSKGLQDRFFERMTMELHNLYGPTEASIDVTFWACERGSSLSTVPIGKPIANTRIYLLDDGQQLVPVGIPGELHIAGVGLARGYHDRPELTAERFIPDPYCPEPGGRLYRTGDRTRYLADGSIEYLDRRDLQVKLRGFRIELGEFEDFGLNWARSRRNWESIRR